jgi:hypothetical protein
VNVASNTTIIEEMTAAARGVGALITGDRRAPSYFDFSDRGLIGSFVAFLTVTGLNAVLPGLLGATGPTASIFRAVAMVAILFACQLAFAALALKQMKRLDGFVPYVVADNWATFFITLVTSVFAMLGLSGDLMLIVLVVLVLIVEINIARLIVTLAPLQIAMFLVAQLVGVSIGLIVLGVLLPLPPEVSAALATQ